MRTKRRGQEGSGFGDQKKNSGWDLIAAGLILPRLRMQIMTAPVLHRFPEPRTLNPEQLPSALCQPL